MATCAESALLHALHLSRPLSRWELPTLRGVDDFGCAGAHQPVDALGLGFGDDGGERFLDAHRLSLVLGVGVPDQRPCVDLVPEDEVDAVLGPKLTRGAGDALVVEGAGDVQHPRTGLGHVEDALDDAGGIGVGFQGGALLGPVLHHDPVVAVGRPAGDPEASGCGLPHTPRNLLGQDIGYPIDTKHCGIRGR